jgi:hypothetical protein
MKALKKIRTDTSYIRSTTYFTITYALNNENLVTQFKKWLIVPLYFFDLQVPNW